MITRLSRSTAFALLYIAVLINTAFAEQEIELPVFGAEVIDGAYTGDGKRGDPQPEKGVGGTLFPYDSDAGLDFYSRSIVVDLGVIQRIRRVELRDDARDNGGTAKNLNAETLQLYQSNDNRSFTPVEKFTFQVHAGANGVFDVIELGGLDLRTRYLKVHTTYDGGDYDFICKRVDRMIAAFGQKGVPPGDRVRVPHGFLIVGRNELSLNAQHFEELTTLDYRVGLTSLHNGKEILRQSQSLRLPQQTNSSSWQLVPFKVPKCEPGLYRLTVERLDGSRQSSIWTEELELRVVQSFEIIQQPASDENIALVPGRCLLIYPYDDPEHIKDWRMDQRDSKNPLWRPDAQGAKVLTIPIRLKGVYAVYAGVLGSSDGLSLSASGQRLTPLSRAKCSKRYWDFPIRFTPVKPQEEEQQSKHCVRENYLGIFDQVETTALTVNLEGDSINSGIAYLKLLCLTPRQIRLARGEEDLSFGRKYIFVSDGYSWLGEVDHRPNRTVEDIRAYARRFEAAKGMVERFDWCPGVSSVIYSYPTKIGELIGKRQKFPRNYDRYATENLMSLIEQGNAPLKIIAQACKEYGLGCFAAVRMSAYYLPPGDDYMNSDFWRNHPECRIRSSDDKEDVHLSYAYPEVRKLYLDLMREMLDYGVDGIHCEFLRYPMYLGFDKPLVISYQNKHGKSPLDPSFSDWEQWYQHRADVMTDFIRSVRAMLNEEGKTRGKRFGLTARIPDLRYFEYGLDPKTWMAEGLVDMIALGSNQYPNMPMHIEPLLKMAEKTSCRIYTSLVPHYGDSRDPTPEDDKAGKYVAWNSGISIDEKRAFVMQEFRKGAMGSYGFNYEGGDWMKYKNLERWDEFENPYRLLVVPYNLPDSTAAP